MPLPSALQLNDAMVLACAEARTWLGATSPNPAVGAVALNAAGHVMATAAHHRAGDLHAEALLLHECRKRGILAEIHTLCITLEPCNHVGRTPACTDALIEAGIKNIAVGTRDVNPEVTGGGIKVLKSAGVTVQVGVNEDECQQLIHSFSYNVAQHKPWVTVKRAFTSAGSMIPPEGHKTFTSDASLKLAHRLRKKAGALLTGSGTILTDFPFFNVRHVQDYPHKKRWLGILDRRGRVPQSYLDAALSRGLQPVLYKDLDQAFDDLHQKGAHDILVEAGPTLSAAVLDGGYSTMSIDIHAGEPDDIITRFSPTATIPFKIDKFDLDYLLPN